MEKLENRISSREVAEMMGREHKNVLKKIDDLNKDLTSLTLSPSKYWVESCYTDTKGEERREYKITELGCELIAHKTIGKDGTAFTVKYMDRFHKMKEIIEDNKPKLPTDYLSALKALVASEEEKQQLQLENNHKQEVIQGFTDNISISDKRSILNKVIRKGGKYKERYSALYQTYKDTYHIDIKKRFENYNINNSPKCKSVLDYADKHLNAIGELYNIACKLFESDVDKLVNEMYSLR